MAILLAVLVLCLALGIVLYNGKGAMLIAGYNTISQEKREQIDEQALCRFVGKIMFADAGALALLALNTAFLNIVFLQNLVIFLMIAVPVSGIIYANTGNRFRK